MMSGRVEEMNNKVTGWMTGMMVVWRNDSLVLVVVKMDDEWEEVILI